MRIKGIAAAGIAILVILGGVFISQLTGTWITENARSPRLITVGEFAGMSDPADIRGSHTFAVIGESFGIEPKEIAAAYGLDVGTRDPGELRANEMELFFEGIDESRGEIGTDSVKWFIALYSGFPYVPEETTLLPSSAAAYLKDAGKIDQEMMDSIQPSLIETELLKADADTEADADADTEADADTGISAADTGVSSSSTDRTVKGNTIFADLYTWGLTEKEIEEVTGEVPGPRSAVIRDYYTNLGLEYGTVRVALQKLVDSK
jgi:hypothetical protein